MTFSHPINYAFKKSISLLAGSAAGLKSKRFVFEILLPRENRGEGTGEKGGIFTRQKNFENKPFRITARFAPANDCVLFVLLKLAFVALPSGTVWIDVPSPSVVSGVANAQVEVRFNNQC